MMYKITKKHRGVGPAIELLDWYDEVARNEFIKFDNEVGDAESRSIEQMEEDMDATDALLAEIGLDAIYDELNQSVIPTFLQMHDEAIKLPLRYVNGEIEFDSLNDDIRAELLNIADHLDAKLIDNMYLPITE